MENPLHRRISDGKTTSVVVSLPGPISNQTFVSLLNALQIERLIPDWSAQAITRPGLTHCWTPPESRVVLCTDGRPGISATSKIVVYGLQSDVNHARVIIDRYVHMQWATAAVIAEDPTLVPYNDRLIPDLWNKSGKSWSIDPVVRQALLRIADTFVESFKDELPEFKHTDVVLTGSSANFNWTPQSDLDLHLVVNMAALTKKYGPLIKDYLGSKKSLWNHLHSITVRGFPVEVYVEDQDEVHVSSGIYSLVDDKWLREPTHKVPKTTDADVQRKIGTLEKMIADAMCTDRPDVVEQTIQRVRAWRQAGLAAGGEQSPENLAYKELRRRGVIQKLFDLKTKTYDRQLMIEDDVWASFED